MAKKKAAKKRIPLTADKKAQRRLKRRQETDFKDFFENLGFKRIKTDGVQITFDGRTGELDEIYVYENLILVVEYTIKKPGSEHLLKKKPLRDRIHANSEGFIDFAKQKYTGFSKALNPTYQPRHYHIRQIYASLYDVTDEHMSICPEAIFMHGSVKKYFCRLAKTIRRSARSEFFNFLGLTWNSVGEAAIKSSVSRTSYEGHLLPDGNSSYPTGYKIVSFYADPETILASAYVLRRDGWRPNSQHLYQRILETKKISRMRKYLIDEKRVFVNNIIATLSQDTAINEQRNKARNLAEGELKTSQPVSILLPAGYNTIGIVDGQHRVFCYHEGNDTYEKQIVNLRKLQQLLVTGIVYPPKTPEAEKMEFEARLFLEINDTQTRTRPALRHDIESIVRPFSGIAVARNVISALSKKGVYAGLFQSSYFDPPSKIKISSIINYGLRPIVKFDGNDSFFSAWTNAKKARLKGREKKSTKEKGKAYTEDLELLATYTAYCVSGLNTFFLAAKNAYGFDRWDLEAENPSPLLRPTVINGLIACLRLTIENNQRFDLEGHTRQLSGIRNFDFNAFRRSSAWQNLGERLYNEFYS